MMSLKRRVAPVFVVVCASVMGLAMYAGVTLTSHSDGPVTSAAAEFKTDSLDTMARKQ